GGRRNAPREVEMDTAKKSSIVTDSGRISPGGLPLFLHSCIDTLCQALSLVTSAIRREQASQQHQWRCAKKHEPEPTATGSGDTQTIVIGLYDRERPEASARSGQPKIVAMRCSSAPGRCPRPRRAFGSRCGSMSARGRVVIGVRVIFLETSAPCG